MSEWLTGNDRDEAIYTLQRRLTPKQMRDILDRDIERIVVKAERSRGLYSSRVDDADLPAFLVDLYGIELLQNRDLRLILVMTLPDEKQEELANWRSALAPVRRKKRAEHIAERKWVPGKQWSRHFAESLDFPKIFAGIVGSPASPAIEEIEPHVPLPELHPYQQELVSGIHQVLQATDTQNRAIVSLPTGAGKTRTVVEALLSWWGSNTSIKPYLLWVAQSDELCEQAVEAFREVWIDRGGKGERKTLRIFRFWGQHDALPEAYGSGVIVASIQKLNEVSVSDERRGELERFADDTAAVIVDEAHHATASSYTSVLEVFGISFGRLNESSVPLLGLTATPYRGVDAEENRRLARRFSGRLLIPASLGDDPIHVLRERHVLSRVDHRELHTGRTFNLTQNELDRFEQLGQLPGSFLRKVGEDAERNALLVKTILDLPPEWPLLCFGCSVEHASALAVLLRRRGRTAAVVTGTTRRATRRYLIDEFRVGRLQVLCNFGVLTTGFDAPRIRAVVIARPTTSVVLYEQMIGRGMRGPLNGGTEECTVIDLADNITRFQGQMAYVRMREFWQD